ncbi:hypothetical protein BABINDRAFT_161830 [Babjeviella inositovora NRRL Y-12698]|uniref:Uncharacterized protein n=1 Tax=Babjeviella inositovora NRRL Y-12698 TaxID=984486 RepID=A0A1E3QP50_9ASCO|nr:uncharacterized protein BABINDRAFT_161830 [Babjeviella inositovora NRRL Y-12698]ODQ79430.1 hypothetical protein BABINDRAFT_161830 [Babjeviella inositovora NRRL Y-12698]
MNNIRYIHGCYGSGGMSIPDITMKRNMQNSTKAFWKKVPIWRLWPARIRSLGF